MHATAQQVPKFKRNEIGCYTAALNAVVQRHQHLGNLPPDALHAVGGLLPETAASVESVINSLIRQGVHQPTVGRVMAEIDRLIPDPT
jgi:hypothetical protein